MATQTGSRSAPNPYAHISSVAAAIHDGLLTWARDRLRDAGQEAVEVYGAFPPLGSGVEHLVLFPISVGPDPKLVETSGPSPLLGPARAEPPQGVPGGLRALGRQLSEALVECCGDRVARPGPRLLSELPPPLRAWFEERLDSDWVDPREGHPRARLPALMWRPGLSLNVRYLAVAGEPGRGVMERSQLLAPVSVRALTVLAAAVHLERVFEVALPGLPTPPELPPFVRAVAASLPQDQGESLLRALDEATQPSPHQIAILPVGELTDELLTQLMQGLQRPLQAALRLGIRMSMAALPSFEPAATMVVSTRAASR